jgi:hypothetical protein
MPHYVRGAYVAFLAAMAVASVMLSGTSYHTAIVATTPMATFKDLFNTSLEIAAIETTTGAHARTWHLKPTVEIHDGGWEHYFKTKYQTNDVVYPAVGNYQDVCMRPDLLTMVAPSLTAESCDVRCCSTLHTGTTLAQAPWAASVVVEHTHSNREPLNLCFHITDQQKQMIEDSQKELASKRKLQPPYAFTARQPTNHAELPTKVAPTGYMITGNSAPTLYDACLYAANCNLENRDRGAAAPCRTPQVMTAAQEKRMADFIPPTTAVPADVVNNIAALFQVAAFAEDLGMYASTAAEMQDAAGYYARRFKQGTELADLGFGLNAIYEALGFNSCIVRSPVSGDGRVATWAAEYGSVSLALGQEACIAQYGLGPQRYSASVKAQVTAWTAGRLGGNNLYTYLVGLGRWANMPPVRAAGTAPAAVQPWGVQGASALDDIDAVIRELSYFVATIQPAAVQYNSVLTGGAAIAGGPLLIHLRNNYKPSSSWNNKEAHSNRAKDAYSLIIESVLKPSLNALSAPSETGEGSCDRSPTPGMAIEMASFHKAAKRTQGFSPLVDPDGPVAFSAVNSWGTVFAADQLLSLGSQGISDLSQYADVIGESHSCIRQCKNSTDLNWPVRVLSFVIAIWILVHAYVYWTDVQTNSETNKEHTKLAYVLFLVLFAALLAMMAYQVVVLVHTKRSCSIQGGATYAFANPNLKNANEAGTFKESEYSTGFFTLVANLTINSAMFLMVVGRSIAQGGKDMVNPITGSALRSGMIF